MLSNNSRCLSSSWHHQFQGCRTGLMGEGWRGDRASALPPFAVGQYRLSHYFALDVQLAAWPAASVDPAGSRFLPARRSPPLTHRGHVFIVRPPHRSLCYLLASPTLSRFQPGEAILADIDLISVASLLACQECLASRDVLCVWPSVYVIIIPTVRLSSGFFFCLFFAKVNT